MLLSFKNEDEMRKVGIMLDPCNPSVALPISTLDDRRQIVWDDAANVRDHRTHPKEDGRATADPRQPGSPIPDLSVAEYNSLKELIRSQGVRVPIIVDQDGKIVDGRQRARICKELGIDCPRVVQHFASDAERLQVAIALNIPRRHWSCRQRRELIAAYLMVDPAINDNELGDIVGVSRIRSPRFVVSWSQLVKLTSWSSVAGGTEKTAPPSTGRSSPTCPRTRNRRWKRNRLILHCPKGQMERNMMNTLRTTSSTCRAPSVVEDSPFRVISTFSGCGGSSLGYTRAGGKVLLAIDLDDNALATYRANFPDTPIYHGDIADLSVKECCRLADIRPGELDILDGSPPCQGFSLLGTRRFSTPQPTLRRVRPPAAGAPTEGVRHGERTRHGRPRHETRLCRLPGGDEISGI